MEFTALLKDSKLKKIFLAKAMEFEIEVISFSHLKNVFILNGDNANNLAEYACIEPTSAVCSCNVQLINSNTSIDNWGLDRIDQRIWNGGDGQYKWSRGGFGTDLYVLDTGLHYSHIEFGGRAEFLYDAVNESGYENGADGHGHGTQIASIAAGARYGVAKRTSTIFSVKVLNKHGSGTIAQLLAGINQTIVHHVTKNNVSFFRPSVANISLTIPGGNLSVDAAVQNMISNGIIVTVAAGNAGGNVNNYSPARVADAITVGASTKSDDLRTFPIDSSLDHIDNPIYVNFASNTGSGLDLFAPGYQIAAGYNFRQLLGSHTPGDPTIFTLGVIAKNQILKSIKIDVDLNNGIIPTVKVGTIDNLIEFVFAGINGTSQLYVNLNEFTANYTASESTEIFVSVDPHSATSGTVSFELDVLSRTDSRLLSGTSAASAFVAGVALLRAQQETTSLTDVSVAAIKTFILSQATENVLNITGSESETPNLLLYMPYNSDDELQWLTESGLLASGNENTAFSTSVVAIYIDLDGNTTSNLEYSSLDLPDWATLNETTGTISGTFPSINSDTTYTFNIIATSLLTNITLSREFSLESVQTFNLPPVWSTASGSLGTFPELSTINIQLVATDPEAATLTYSLLNQSLPTGLSLSSSGLITGTVSGIVADLTKQFTVRVSDGTKVADRSFSITITAINSAPIWYPFTPLGDHDLGTYTVGNMFSNDFISDMEYVEDPNGDSLSFTKTGTLPPGLSLTSSGLLSGVFSTVGEYDFIITASDGSLSASRTFRIVVEESSGNQPPTWLTETDLGTVDENSVVSKAILAIDPEGSTVFYTLQLGSGEEFPSGLALNSSGLISGIAPDRTTDKTYTFTIKATDDLLSASTRTFTLTVQNTTGIAQPEWITPAGNIGSVNEFTPSTLKVEASDSDGGALMYEVTSGSLPAGLTLHSDSGLIIGQPNGVGSTTTYSFEVTVSDDTFSIPRSFSLTVNHVITGNSLYVNIPVQGDGKTELVELQNEIFKNNVNSVYRYIDDNFGISWELVMYLVSGLRLAPSGESRLDYENIFAEHLDNRFYKTRVLLNDLRVAVARDSDDNILYEVLYISVTDPLAKAASSAAYPQASSSTHQQGISYILPPSLVNMRNELISEYTQIGGVEFMPLWMTSEQTVGDTSSVIGWTPAIVLGYVQAGTGQSIINSLSQDIKDMVTNYPLIVDRFILLSEEEVNRRTTFDANATTFDDDLTTFDNNGPSRQINKYIKFPPGDVLGVRPTS